MKDQIDREGQDIRNLFSEAEESLQGPTPYMRTRILANLREGRANQRTLLWKRLAFSSPIVSAIVLAVVFLNGSEPAFRASVNEKVLVKVEVQGMKEMPVSFAEIELPSNVFFYSEKYPELASQKQIRLAWSYVQEMGSLPIVIQSRDAGIKPVKVRFLDHDLKLVKEREIAIQFEALVKHGSSAFFKESPLNGKDVWI